MKQSKFTCAHCRNNMYRDAHDSMFPEEGTPPEDISTSLGHIRFSLYCDNPKCRKYTITCIHSQDMERLMVKYGQKIHQ